ncbi:nitrilase [Apiospora kogelbergensis]|uniref:nitrilase n=1 Tax=Apiospora kogelbergensis TaxID=1337665 RepID=UPI0031318F66
MAPVFKVALIQLHPQPVAPAENFAKATAFIKDAAKQGCHLAVLPEYHLTSWVPDDPQFRQSCIESMKYLEKYQALAKELNICIVPGTIVEARSDDDTSTSSEGPSMLNVAYFVSSSGDVVGRYQKKNLWHPERHHLVSSAHEPHEAFDTPLGRVGMVACWDLAFPEAFRELISDGAEIICVPSFWTMRDVNDEGWELNNNGEAEFLNSAIVTRAFENTQLALPHVGSIGRMGRAEGMNVVELDKDVLRIAEENYKVRADMKREGWHYAYTRIREGGKL